VPGFDIIVGNPPFVTARNPQVRELYRDRWPTSCFMKYHLLAPFTELALVKLLRPNGQFGYIVSNAFATRDFGKPLIKQVFTRMELLNVIDCQGLSFPGHGTPTCIVLGYGIAANVKETVSDTGFRLGKPIKATILCSTRLGKGQLQQEAEETELWKEIETGWEKNNFAGNRVLNAIWETQFRRIHPWSLNAASADFKSKMQESGHLLHRLLKEDIGFACIIGADDMLNNDEHQYRRLIPMFGSAKWLVEGDNIRDWSVERFRLSVAAYDESWLLKPINTLGSKLQGYFSKFKRALENRADFGALTYAETGKPWWGYHQVTTSKYMSPSIIYGQIATHMHCLDCPQQSVIKHSVQLISFKEELIVNPLLSLLNSSSALYYLKQICYNKGAGAVEERDRFDYAGGKVEQLPIPVRLLDNKIISKRASLLSDKCSELGIIISGLQPRKLK